MQKIFFFIFGNGFCPKNNGCPSLGAAAPKPPGLYTYVSVSMRRSILWAGEWSPVLCVTFTVQLGDITVDSIHPLYGPMSGGTRVTISGQFLSVYTVIAVHFGQYTWRPETNRLWILCN